MRRFCLNVVEVYILQNQENNTEQLEEMNYDNI